MSGKDTLKVRVNKVVLKVTGLTKTVLSLLRSNGTTACELTAIKKILVAKGIATDQELTDEIKECRLIAWLSITNKVISCRSVRPRRD